jgi:hypothetical protein
VFAVVASVYSVFQISDDGETNWISRPPSLRYVILGILFFICLNLSRTSFLNR